MEAVGYGRIQVATLNTLTHCANLFDHYLNLAQGLVQFDRVLAGVDVQQLPLLFDTHGKRVGSAGIDQAKVIAQLQIDRHAASAAQAQFGQADRAGVCV
ncbi:hypothetical protein D3C80_1995910 [compost metagenome]